MNMEPASTVRVSSPMVSSMRPLSSMPACSWGWWCSGTTAPSSISRYESITFRPYGVRMRQPGRICSGGMLSRSTNGIGLAPLLCESCHRIIMASPASPVRRPHINILTLNLLTLLALAAAGVSALCPSMSGGAAPAEAPPRAALRRPVALAATDGLLFAANRDAGTVSVLDPDRGAVVHEVSVGG